MNRSVELSGIGMTSQRTRERMVQRLVEQGIGNIAVLEAMRAIPRHLFLDEAMAHRAYEDTALPIGYQQTPVYRPKIKGKKGWFNAKCANAKKKKRTKHGIE